MESRRKSRVRSLPRATARLHGREVREILLPRRVSFREPFELLFRGEGRKYIANCIVIHRDIYIWGDNGDAAMEEGSPPPRMGMTGGMKSAGIVGDPGTRMLGRLAITITIEGEGSSDTRRAATTRRSERPNRASRSSTLACPYWAWASPARRTRTTASTIICRTCLPRTSSRSSSYDPTARPPSCPRLSLSIRVSNVPRKNKEEKTIWLFTRRVTRRKRAAIPIDIFRRRKKSIESYQTIVSTSISIEIHEIYIFFPSIGLRFVDSPAIDRYSFPRYRVIDVSCDIIRQFSFSYFRVALLSLSLWNHFYRSVSTSHLSGFEKKIKICLKIWFVRFDLFTIID